MATKAELVAELAALKREMAQRQEADAAPAPAAPKEADAAKEPVSVSPAAAPEVQTVPEAQAAEAQPLRASSQSDELHQFLAEHDINVENVEALGTNLADEVTTLLKEKPLVVLIATFALGCLVGRAMK